MHLGIFVLFCVLPTSGTSFVAPTSCPSVLRVYGGGESESSPPGQVFNYFPVRIGLWLVLDIAAPKRETLCTTRVRTFR